jgi:hypothetical protein
MEEDQLDRVRRELQPFTLDRGDTLIREGEEGDALYIIAGGRLEATTGNPPVKIGEVTPGEIVGETALLTGEPRSATVTATTNAHGYRLERVRVMRVIEEHPEEMRRIAELITRRSAGPRREQFRPSQEEDRHLPFRRCTLRIAPADDPGRTRAAPAVVYDRPQRGAHSPGRAGRPGVPPRLRSASLRGAGRIRRDRPVGYDRTRRGCG